MFSFKNIFHKSKYPLVFLSYLSIFVAVFSDVVFFGMSFVTRDIVRFYYPMWRFSKECLQQGFIPLWNPYAAFGTPFFANVQTCVFYPMSVLLHLGDFTWSFNFYILTHLAMAAFFTYVWMRDCEVSPVGSWLSGFAFGFSGYLMSSINLTISLASVAYFPLVLFFYRRAIGTPGLRWVALSAILLLVQYLAGDPSIVFVTFFILFVFTLFKIADIRSRESRWDFASLKRFILMAVFFVGLSAFQMIPFVEFIAHTGRSHMTFSDSMKWSVPPSDLLGLLVPYLSDIGIAVQDYGVRQGWLEFYYSGVTVLGLVILALGVKKRKVSYLLLLFLVGIALSLGKNSLIYVALHRYFPLLGFIRYPARFFFLCSFALACLAGFGFDRLISVARADERTLEKRKFLPWFLGLMFLMLATFAILIYFGPVWHWCSKIYTDFTAHWDRPKFFVHTMTAVIPVTTEEINEIIAQTVMTVLTSIRWSLFFGLLTAMTFFVTFFTATRRVLMGALMVILVFLDLLLTNISEPRIHSYFFNMPMQNLSVLSKDKTLFRVMASPKALEDHHYFFSAPSPTLYQQIQESNKLQPGYNQLFRLYDANSYDSLFLKDILDIRTEFVRLRSPSQNRFLEGLNIKYISSPLESLGERYLEIHKHKFYNAPYRLFKSDEVLPRAYLVSRAATEKNRKIILDRLIELGYDPEKMIYIEEEVPVESDVEGSPGGLMGEDRVEIVKYAPNEVTLKTKVTSRRWLFLSDTHYPGWRVKVNGVAQKIYRANYAFRAVYLEAGTHTVEWNYQPLSILAGLLVSLTTVLALAIALLKTRRKNHLNVTH